MDLRRRTKRALVALAQDIKISNAIRQRQTYQVDFDEVVGDEDWNLRSIKWTTLPQEQLESNSKASAYDHGRTIVSFENISNHIRQVFYC